MEVSNPSVDNDNPYGIATDCGNSGSIYIVGNDRFPGSSQKPGKGNKGESNAQLRIEKRACSDLSLQDTATDNPTDNFDTYKGIAIDSDYLYLIGSSEIGFFDTEWIIEKRELSGLSLVGDRITEDFGYDDQPEGIVVDADYMYIAGYIAPLGGGGDTAWQIEKRSLSDWSDCYTITHDINGLNNDRAYAIDIDEDNVYVAGYYNPGLPEWIIENRSKRDLTLGWMSPVTPPPLRLSHILSISLL